jgi:hypothetical protein
MKFYEAVNCNRTIVSEGLAFNFAPYELIGTWHGVFATEKPEEIKALDALLEAKAGVYSLTEEQYNACIKKKTSAQNSYSGSLAASVPLPSKEGAPSAAPAIDANLQPQPVEPPVAPLENVEEAVPVVPVKKKK